MKFTVDERYSADRSVALRYAPALLNGLEFTDISRQEGIRILDLGAWRGVNLKLLDESSLMASGTYKSLDGCLSTALCRKEGIRRVVFSSGANAGAALSLYGAATGLESFFFCPAGNLNKLDGAVFDRPGAHLIAVEGSDRRVKQAAKLAAERLGVPVIPTLEWRMLSAGCRGMFLAEQILRGEHFDWLVQSVCAGYGPIGIYRVFERLAVPSAPKFLAVQQGGLCPIVNAWEQHRETLPPLADTEWHEKPIEPALYNVHPDHTYPELYRLLQRWGGDALAVHQAEFEQFASEFLARVEAAGVTLTRVNGQIAERAGLLAGAGALKAIAGGRIPAGATVLCALTGGAGPAPSKPAVPERRIGLEDDLDAH
ncbi:MAG: pyridoxal-phosphate dependent enzyme [Verrucomicrobia bacterium]|nr:pyridoxal-phosphate dependent enzyme [Verrucomicrobiota bacterium]